MVILEKSGAVPRWGGCFQVGWLGGRSPAAEPLQGHAVGPQRRWPRVRAAGETPAAGANVPGMPRERAGRPRFPAGGRARSGWVAEGEQHGGEAMCQAPQRGPVLHRAGGVALPYVGRELLQAAGAVGLEQKLFARKAAGIGLRLIVGRFIRQRGACGRRIGRGLGHQRQRFGHAGLQLCHRRGFGHHAPHLHGLQLFAHGGCQACAEHRHRNPAALHGFLQQPLYQVNAGLAWQHQVRDDPLYAACMQRLYGIRHVGTGLQLDRKLLSAICTKRAMELSSSTSRTLGVLMRAPGPVEYPLSMCWAARPPVGVCE